LPAGTPVKSASGDVLAPYPFAYVPAGQAERQLARLRSEWPTKAPVIWGAPEWAYLLFKACDAPVSPTVEEILERAKRSSDELFAVRREVTQAGIRKLYEMLGTSPPDSDDSRDEPHDAADGALMQWSGSIAPMVEFPTLGAPDADVMIGLVPTVRSWEVPAYMQFGAWNACPAPELHVALGREWSTRFGAQLVANTHDQLIYEIARPITSRDEAISVARVQDRYAEFERPIGEIAASILGARYWQFWWD
jgi:Domain of unknown function (DUF4253)